MTVGQRRGVLPGRDGERRFVARVDLAARRVEVGRLEDILIECDRASTRRRSRFSHDALVDGTEVLAQWSAHGDAAARDAAPRRIGWSLELDAPGATGGGRSDGRVLSRRRAHDRRGCRDRRGVVNPAEHARVDCARRSLATTRRTSCTTRRRSPTRTTTRWCANCATLEAAHPELERRGLGDPPVGAPASTRLLAGHATPNRCSVSTTSLTTTELRAWSDRVGQGSRRRRRRRWSSRSSPRSTDWRCRSPTSTACSTQAATRGDGRVGEDVTENVRTNRQRAPRRSRATRRPRRGPR